MPANQKYLTASAWQRFGKISAAILGSYFVTVSFHLALANWFSRAEVMITMAFSGFIMWAGLMVVAFIAKSWWKIWVTYLLLTLCFAALMFAGQQFYSQG